MGDAEDGVAAQTPGPQLLERGRGPGPVGDQAQLGMEPVARHEPNERLEVGAEWDGRVLVMEVADRGARLIWFGQVSRTGSRLTWPNQISEPPFRTFPNARGSELPPTDSSTTS